jgi:hypothetical protein
MANGKARFYPWSALELDETTDQSLIRKAYAAKLKVTRPDGDARAFQDLIEARDLAIALALSDPPSKQKRTTRKPRKQAKPNKKTKKTQQGEAARISASATNPPLAQPKQSENDDSGRSEGEIDLARLTDDVGYFLDHTEKDPEPARAQAALSLIHGLSLSERENVEPEILEIVAPSLPYALHYSRRGRMGDVQRSEAMAWFINALDDEFNWTNNDRRFYELTCHINEDAIDQLHELLQKRPPAQPAAAPAASSPWYINGVGIWVLLWVLYQVLKALFVFH